MILRYSLLGCVLFCWGCKNIEDAKPSDRKTFIKVYEAAHNIYGVSAEASGDGYVIVGNETLANGTQNIVIINTDQNGEKLGDAIILEGGSANALKVTSDGYYIIGDSIKFNLQSSDVDISDLLVYSARLYKLDANGNIINKLVIADKAHTSKIADIHGNAVTINGAGEVVVLGTQKAAAGSIDGTTEKPFIVVLKPATLETVWSKNYDIIERDYVNSKTVHASPSGNIIWASALLKENQNFSRSYLTVPYVKENSTFENYGEFGQTTDQQLYAKDIQPAASAAFGYGIIGSNATPTGTGSNMFFIRVDQFGNIIHGSERYFDGLLSLTNVSVTADQSSTEDTGDALTATHDGGFVLAGTMLTTPDRGNGGRDILLIKLDSQGNIVWNKVIGGAGDETVNSIRETADNGLLICGSNNVSGLSSVFVLKTDENGQLEN